MNRDKLHRIGNNLLVDAASIILAFASVLAVINAINTLYSVHYTTSTFPPDSVSSATYSIAYAIGFALTIFVTRKYKKKVDTCNV